MSAAAHKTIWYPFTQHKHLTPDKITVIDSAQGDYFQTLAPPPTTSTTSTTETTPPPPAPAQPTPNRDDPNPGSLLLHPSFDGSASWWTQGLGHGSPQLALAAAYAAGRYGHVMFAEAAHEPALALAEALLRGLRGGGGSGGGAGGNNRRLARAFFSDNGSTGVEVAVKMALRAARGRYGWEGRGKTGEGKVGVLGLRGSYHGDTIGAMDCSEPGVFNEKVEWYEGKGLWFAYPVVEYRRGEWVVEVPEEMRHLCGGRERFRYSSLSAVFDVVTREQGQQGRIYEQFITATLERLAAQGRKFGALMLEPVVLGAGGMLLV
jgi:dethiobiotin synthetase/adenosylmethionine--8-amino-7-oxononanoate aminotransferase